MDRGEGPGYRVVRPMSHEEQCRVPGQPVVDERAVLGFPAKLNGPVLPGERLG